MIFVAAGHDPLRKGAVWHDFNEHDEARLWVDAIAGFTACTVVPPVTLREKVAWINEQAKSYALSSIALEVHFNAGGKPGRASGCETLYMPASERGALLADFVQNALAPIFPPSRGCKEAWYRQDHPHRIDYPGDVEGDEVPDYFCKATICPAVIVEPDFIWNRMRIVTSRERACLAVAEALAVADRYLNVVREP